MSTLILLDIMMPKLDGMGTLKLLKQSEKTQRIPVFMLTNVSSPEDAENALKLGAVKFLNKSVYEPDQILEIIKSYFYSAPMI